MRFSSLLISVIKLISGILTLVLCLLIICCVAKWECFCNIYFLMIFSLHTDKNEMGFISFELHVHLCKTGRGIKMALA